MKSHGGKRKGAGRKPAPVPGKTRNIYCTDPGWKWLNDEAKSEGHSSVGKWADAEAEKGKKTKGKV